MNIPNSLKQIVKRVAEFGGTVFLGGGAVRDAIISELQNMGENFTPKDFDCEIHGLTLDTVKAILLSFGNPKSVGESFGVIKLRIGDDEFDFSLPRRESKSGNGHKGFVVEFDQSITIKEACSRRDLTINSALINLATGELVDPFNARADIEAKVLRHTSPAFADDPLRPLRIFQFASRFGFTVAPETADLCKKMIAEFKTLPVERVWVEWEKWTRGSKPSFGLRALVDIGWDVLFPEVARLKGLVQQPEYHPEGDVFSHVCLCVDEAVRIVGRDNLNNNDRHTLVFAALCHDFGKATTTRIDGDGRITSHGHDVAGEAPTVAFLTSIGAPKDLIEAVVPLVTEHMIHVCGEINDRVVRRLSARISPHGKIEMLSRVIEVDHSGRNLPKGNPCPALMEIANRLAVANSKPAPIVTGKMLMEMGFKPGRSMGDILRKAFEEQLNGNILEMEPARVWVRSNFNP